MHTLESLLLSLLIFLASQGLLVGATICLVRRAKQVEPRRTWFTLSVFWLGSKLATTIIVLIEPVAAVIAEIVILVVFRRLSRLPVVSFLCLLVWIGILHLFLLGLSCSLLRMDWFVLP